MSSEDEGTEMVTITAERFRQLEEAEALLAEAQERLKKRNNNNIERLRAYIQENPEKAKERAVEKSKRYKEKNREAYNARRRELYKIKKAQSPGSPPAVETPNLNPGVKVEVTDE